MLVCVYMHTYGFLCNQKKTTGSSVAGITGAYGCSIMGAGNKFQACARAASTFFAHLAEDQWLLIHHREVQ